MLSDEQSTENTDYPAVTNKQQQTADWCTSVDGQPVAGINSVTVLCDCHSTWSNEH